MRLSLARFAAPLEPDTHAIAVLDQAGGRGSERLVIPANVALAPLPPYSPDLTPVARVWLYLRERFLSHRGRADYRAVIAACCSAWDALAAETGRIRSLCAFPRVERVTP